MDLKIETGSQSKYYKPYLTLKPYFVNHMDYVSDEVLSRFNLKLSHAYKIREWDKVAKKIYQPTIEELGESFETGLLSHIELVKRFWSNSALLLFFHKNECHSKDYQSVKRFKEYLRENLPGGSSAKDFIMLGNLEYLAVKESIKKRIPMTMPFIGDSAISRTKGRWDNFFFKYIHCPDSVEQCAWELKTYKELGVINKTNYISTKEFAIMQNMMSYTIPREVSV